MGLDDNIGALAFGKLADLAALDLRLLDAGIDANTINMEVPSLLLRGRANQAVSYVRVAGGVVVAGYRPTT